MFVNGTCCSRTLVLSTTSTSMASSLANRYLLTPTIVSKEVTKTELWLLITRSLIAPCEFTEWSNYAGKFGGVVNVSISTLLWRDSEATLVTFLT